MNAGLLLARQLQRERETDDWAAQFLLSFPPMRYLAAPGEEILGREDVSVLPLGIPRAVQNK